MNQGAAGTVCVTGSTGMVGRRLCRLLAADGHRVVRYVRDRSWSGDDAAYWSPARGEIHPGPLEGALAVVHLAGENLAAGRWTEDRKRRILDSRVEGTRLLSETLARLEQKPSVLVSASGVTYYGDRGDEPVDETASSGHGFLARVCRHWEAETVAAARAGVRVVNLRIGPVLSPEGGMLGRMLPFFKAGLGGRVGRGDQYVSWIAVDDVVRAVRHAVTESRLEGPVNAVAPNPVTNAEFTKTLGRVLRRPTIFPVPAAALELAFGKELSREALLTGQRVVPRRLADTEFEWEHPELEPALRHLLG
ncbi:MAG: TIGR01777 family oxidoreductase [Myxococcota bacterium]